MLTCTQVHNQFGEEIMLAYENFVDALLEKECSAPEFNVLKGLCLDHNIDLSWLQSQAIEFAEHMLRENRKADESFYGHKAIADNKNYILQEFNMIYLRVERIQKVMNSLGLSVDAECKNGAHKNIKISKGNTVLFQVKKPFEVFQYIHNNY